MSSERMRTTEVVQISLVSTVGSGLIFSTQLLYHALDSAVAVLAAWLCAGLLTLVQALCYAELAEMVPTDGGDAAYVAAAFHPALGAFYSLCSVVVVLPASAAVGIGELCKLVQQYLPVPTGLCAGLLVAGTLVPFLMSRQVWRRVAAVFFVAKIVCVAVAMLLFVTALSPAAVSSTSAGPAEATGVASSTKAMPSVHAFLRALVDCTFFFAGYNSCNYVADEARPLLYRGYKISTAVITALYMSVSAILIMAFQKDLPSSTQTLFVIIERAIGTSSICSAVAHALNAILVAVLYLGPILGCHIVAEGITSTAMKSFDVNGQKLSQRTRQWSVRTSLIGYGILIVAAAWLAAAGAVLHYTAVLMNVFYALTFLGQIKLRKRWESPRKLATAFPVVAAALSSGIALFTLVCN